MEAQGVNITVDVKKALLGILLEIEHAYDYAYVNRYYQEDRGHTSLQRIRGGFTSARILLNSMQEPPASPSAPIASTGISLDK